MNLFDQIKSSFQKKSKSIDPPEGICQNCWGRQEYGGKVFEVVKTEEINLKNIDQKKGWIEAYAIRHLEGIKLKKQQDGITVCPACKLSYHPQ